ncbi:MAG TPA: hypothetical protein VHX52_11075 [Steroidobacteraceae bacterium]|jgi:hypothetical protein|nr:hypothetical protein [Steroidobacteraceae bacterium]
MRRAWVVLIAAAVAALAAALVWQRQHSGHGAVIALAVRGGDGGGLPVAPPGDEHLDAAALELAARDPAAAGLAAFIVMRHGHVIFERFGHGLHADSVIDSGPFARVLVALAAGIAEQDGALPGTALFGFDPSRLRDAIESGTHRSYADYLSSRLWSRLNAGPAWIALPAAGATPPADCCFHARVIDWMRVAGLLVDDGSFEDTQVVGRGWVARMRRPLSPRSREGFGVQLAPAGPAPRGFDAADVFFVRGPGRWRLWLVPSLRLAVLFGAAGGASGAPAGAGTGWDETRLPDLVISAITDRSASPQGQSLLQQLVPGH